MNTQHLYRYGTLAALMSFWSCSSSLKTAQNAGEADDLYGNSANAQVYADNTSDASTVTRRPTRQPRYERQQQRYGRDTNPDYATTDEQSGYDANTDEYYSELSARKLGRGLSADPGWNDNGANAYTSGFANGYNSAAASAYSWNRWGFNNTGFYNGLGLGLGLGAFGGYGGYSSFGFGSPFYSPFYGNSFAYSPFYGGGFGGYGYGYNSFYDPFYGSYYGGGYGYNSFYSPFYGGGFYGGGYGRPVYVNSVIVAGADPYRNRNYIPSNGRSAGRYTSAFDNSARTYNPNGGRRSDYSSSTNPYTNSGNASSNRYARPNASSRGTYYYDNGTSGGGRSATTGSYNNSAPAYNSNANSDYYARPRQSSRGSYTPDAGTSGGRGSYSSPSYSAPSYSAPSHQSYSQPSYQSQSRGSYSQPSYSAPSPSYSAPSGGGSSGGGGGHSGGGSRGPR